MKEFPKMLYKTASDYTTVQDEDAESVARSVGYVDYADLPDSEAGVAANDPIAAVEAGEVVEQKPAKGRKPATYIAPSPGTPLSPIE